MTSTRFNPRRWRKLSFIFLVFTNLFAISILFPHLFNHHISLRRWEWDWRISDIRPFHRLQSDGRLEVNMQGRHPILELMALGEAKWNKMTRRQSKSLQEAVAEYRRRYRRDPPKGFDSWWNFASEHHIRLVDEFDQINFDIEPLLALPQSILHARHRTLKKEMEDWGFQIRVENGNARLEGGKHRNTGRAKDLARLVSGFATFLPDLEFSVSNHDRGTGILAADLRQYAHATVLEKKTLTEQELKIYEDTRRHLDRRGLVHACSPDSAALNLLATKQVSSSFKFVVDHNRTTMDFCVSPYLLDAHGSFARDSARSSRIVPMFAHCKDAQDSSLLLPALPGWKAFDRDRVISWEERVSPKLFWRGRSTGCHFSRKNGRVCSQRIRLHLLAQAKDGEVELLLQDRPGGKLRREPYSQVALNKAYLDVGLVGPPIQCEEADGTCELMEKEISWLKPVGESYGADYKFQLDVDGNGWSQRFRKLLATGSVVLKATVFPEWNTDWLVPWYHYVPIQVDYSDLYNTMAFFAGSPERGLGAYDDLAARIGNHSVAFVEGYWRWEDMQGYVFRLLLEYARAMSEDREAMSFHL